MVRVPDPGVAGDRRYYERLEVDPEASHDDIVHAYRRLALGAHPDAHPEDPAAPRRFREITEAYEVLGDPGRRESYDRTRGTASVPVRVISSSAPGRGQPAGEPSSLREEAPPTFLGSPRDWPGGGVPLRVGPVRIEVGSGDLTETPSTTPRAPWWGLAELFEFLESCWRR
jgi:curved DNA-binding protein CbpA